MRRSRKKGMKIVITLKAIINRVINMAVFKQDFDPFRFLTGILMGAFFIYNTNCLTAGNCNVWAWVQAIMPLVAVVFTLLSLAAFADLVNNKVSTTSTPT